MTRVKTISAGLAVAVTLVLGLACRSAGANSIGANTVGEVEETPATTAFGAGTSRVALSQVGGGQVGISVTGRGTVTLEPDLALLNVGVEATARTVSEARGEASRAMDAIISALHEHSVEDKDIQTRFFNISPRYEYREVFEEGVRSGSQVLVGYTVSNSARVKVRDMTTLGGIIDDVAEAGGDATRINGISFTVEDVEARMTELRELAVKDALAKAEQFAELTGVSLGRLFYISEAGAGAPVVRDFAQREFAVAAAAAPPSTPIGGGELDLEMTIQALFDIG